MRKSSSDSPRDRKPGSRSTFKRDGDSKPFGKSGKPPKKNYDGRGPSSGAPGDGNRSSRPYSGRVTDGDASKRPYSDRAKPSGKPAFNKENKHWKGEDERRPNDSRPFSDRPKRSFDKPSFGKDSDRGERKPFSDRPKRSFDKPSFGKDSDRGERKPFGDKPKRSFDKPSFGKDSDRGERKPFGDKPKRSFDKPSFGKDDSRGERKPFGDKPKRSFDKPSYGKDDSRGERKPFSDRPKRSFDKPSFGKDDSKGERKPFSDRPKRAFDKPSYGKGDDKRGDRKAGGAGADSRPFRDRPKKSFDKPGFSEDSKGNGSDAEMEQPTFGKVMNNAFNPPKKKKVYDETDPSKPRLHEDQVFGELEDEVTEEKPKKFKKVNSAFTKKKFIHDHSEGRKKKYKDDEDEDDEDKEINQKEGPRLEMPLNKYIAHSGECSRRDAAELVRQGKVKVNEELILDPGYRVKHDDRVTMSGKKLLPQKGMVYILLNKPKGFITTNEDPQGRKTVMELVGNSGVDRLFPVGRLDKDTSGLLLITNDGELTQKLCHPSYNIKKVYQVTLDRVVTKADFEKIVAGVDLEDGKAIVDEIAYLEKKNEIGLEIHSGKNRIVRRIFESLGYVVEKLDRMMYAGLTKKNLPRGKWRYLDEREVVLLKHFKN